MNIIIPYKKFLGLTWIAVLSVHWLLAQDFDEKKIITKSYQVDKDANLSIDSRFGKVHIDTWEKNQIEVEITIQAEARSRERAREVIDRIKIDIFDNSPTDIQFVTRIRDNLNRDGRNRFEINYQVSMPQTNSLEISHSHGDVFVDDVKGDVDIDLSHGQLLTEKLTGRSKIDISHGNGGRILEMTKGRLEIHHYRRLRAGTLGNVNLTLEHSDLAIENSTELDAEIRHSQFEIENSGNLVLDCAHSNLGVGQSNNILVDLQHSEIEINNLSKVIEADVNHSEVRLRKVAKDFELIDLNGNHSYFNINVENNADYSVDVRLNHGRMRYNSDEIPLNYVDIRDNTERYKGKIGTGEGTIRVVGNHGDLRLNLVD